MLKNVVTPEDFFKLKEQRPVSDEVIMKYVNTLNEGILNDAAITSNKWAEVVVSNSFLDLTYELCIAIADKFIEAGWYSVYCTLGNSDVLSTSKWVFLTYEQEDNWIAGQKDKGTYVKYTLVGSKECI